MVFDLDGTLVNSAPQITASLGYALQQVGRAPLEESTVMSMIGDGVPTLTARAFEVTGGRDEILEKSVISEFHDHYREIAHTSAAYAMVPETLEALFKAGHRLGLCTNKSADGTSLVLKTLGIEKLFTTIINGDTLPQRKPRPEPLIEAIQGLGYTPQQAIYIGDGPVDVATARSAQVLMVAVSYGYARMPPDQLGADYLIHRMEDLPTLLTQIP
ncbi:MAG: phosphoglycolate phosphatase [Alphaproteobacteria bacterium]